MARPIALALLTLSILACNVRADLMEDSPVTFPKKGAIPSKFPPDVRSKHGGAPEKGYYLFTTPQGDVEISARAMSNEWLTAGVRVSLVLAAALLVAALVRLLGRGSFNWLIGKTGSTCLIVAGLLGCSLFPVIGLTAVVIGTMAKIQRAGAVAN